MIFIEDLLTVGDIKIIFGEHTPWQGKYPFKIVTDNARLH